MKITVLIENTAIRPELHAEHGLSLYIEACGKKILFDAGQSGVFAENAEMLGIDLAKVDIAILSHGHYDHADGLPRFLEINDHAPVYINRNAVGNYRSSPERYIGIVPSLKDNPRVIFTDDFCDLGNGMSLCTMNGENAPYTPFGNDLTMEVDGQHVTDSFHHEQYLSIRENGRHILISGCSHKGIMNIMHWLHPDILVGGFHFMKLDPASEQDSKTLKNAAEILLSHPADYYTGHCTGEAPYAFIKEIMGEKLHYIAGGTICEF